MNSKVAVVTGAAGFIGTNIINRLLSEEIQVIGVFHNAPPRISNSKVTWIQADLTDTYECDKIFQKAKEMSSGEIDYLVMAAAFVGGAEKLLNSPMSFVTDTTVINLYVLQSAYKYHVKQTLYISSGMGYAESRFPLTEEHAMDGEPYEKYYFGGWSRRYTEIICKMYAEKINNPMNISVIRIDNIYGPYDSFSEKKSHVTAALIRKVVERHNPLEVWGDGLDYKDFIYVEDLVDGALLALKSAMGFNLYNIASGQNVTVNELLHIILKVDGYENVSIVYNMDKPTMIPYKVTCIDKAKKDLGFEAKTSLEEGISKTIKWYRQNRSII